ncbi:hypothetical protein V8C26DRAFT_359059 [Trichoderma gracile]
MASIGGIRRRIDACGETAASETGSVNRGMLNDTYYAEVYRPMSAVTYGVDLLSVPLVVKTDDARLSPAILFPLFTLGGISFVRLVSSGSLSCLFLHMMGGRQSCFLSS